MSGPVAALVSGLVDLVLALTTPKEPARELVDTIGRIAAIEAMDYYVGVDYFGIAMAFYICLIALFRSA